MKRRTELLLVLARLGAPLALATSCGRESVGDPVDDLGGSLDADGPGAMTTDRNVGAFPGFGVAIAVDGDDVVLTWAPTPGVEYHVWRATELEALPTVPGPLVGGPGLELFTPSGAMYIDAGAADHDAPTPIYFYRVLASSPAGDELSTIVAKVSTAAAEGYTKLGLCLLDGPAHASELSAQLGDAVQSVHTWDETAQSWRWWWSVFGDGPFGDLALPFGGAVSVSFDETVSPYVSLVGTVPTSELPLQPVEGLNILTTPIVGVQATPTASAFVDELGLYDGVGRWDPVTQTASWYRGPGDQDFALEPCHAYYFEGTPPEPTPQVLSLGELGDKAVRLQGIAAGDMTGWAVNGAGDINGDGFDDVSIGSHGEIDPSAGESYLVYGGPGLPAVIGLADVEESKHCLWSIRTEGCERYNRLRQKCVSAIDSREDRSVRSSLAVAVLYRAE
jgi:FG-GAP repeat